MGTLLGRNDFKKQYPAISQGLFLFEKERHIPGEQMVINVGQKLSDALLNVPPEERSAKAPDILRTLLGEDKLITLEHIEILFTPSLNMNPVAVILSYCRNRKICVAWPGTIRGELLIYDEPGSPEYYAVNYRGFIDTYIITGGM